MRIGIVLFSIAVTASGASAQTMLDFTGAVIVTPARLTGPENKAIQMLVEEVEKRTQVRLARASSWPSASGPVIAVGSVTALREFAGPHAAKLAAEAAPAGAEGYRLRVETAGAAPAALVIGSDARGVLFGVGRLLRSLVMTRRKIELPAGVNITTAPQTPLRGHQLGYRPKTNSYDGWTLAMWEQYIRDLVVFGTNAVELIPPRSDDAADSPHFPLSQIETMVGMSRLLDEYGLDVWIWYPALDKDYSNPETVEFALREWGEVFRRLPRINAILVPGGDPGHTHPVHLMALLEKQTANLRRYHPKAQMWVAPQSFNQEWADEFYRIIQRAPEWLSGLVYGPQTRVSLAKVRELAPKKYPIRHYPDITHSRHSQYPAPDWDLAYALTLAREPINPRPLGMAHIFRLLQKHTIGYITYSEGCNDDVNKIVWSGLGWDEKADVTDLLRQYSQYFIGPAYRDSFAQGLLALERNWQGPLLTNDGVYATLQQFQALERAAGPQELLNWRFQQALYRAYYDAYTRSRLLYETRLEDEAMAALREAPARGSLAAVAEAEASLDRAVAQRPSADWRARVFELAEALFQSIRMQLSVERYKAISVGRGANLDTVDMPLNSRPWLKQQFAEIRRIAAEPERLKAIHEILNWTNPGPGGFYDDLGNLTKQPHLVRGPGFAADPAFYESSLAGFTGHTPTTIWQAEGPRSWWDHAEALYDAPLRMRYTGLDAAARYRIRVVYAGDQRKSNIRLEAEGAEVHAFTDVKFRRLEFDIPAEATRDGELNLSWFQTPGGGGAGRGCQVAEVWLMKITSPD